MKRLETFQFSALIIKRNRRKCVQFTYYMMYSKNTSTFKSTEFKSFGKHVYMYNIGVLIIKI